MPIIRAQDMPVEHFGADSPCGASETRWIGDPGGLTHFGAFVEVLQPGSRSSIRHWHQNEDELVYVLSGSVTVHEGDAVSVLEAGDAAAFPAGADKGHFLENKASTPSTCLIVGTRAPADVIHYPDHARRCIRIRALPDDVWTDEEGKAATSVYAG